MTATTGTRDQAARDLARRTLETLLLCATRSGHLAQRVGNESRGNCLPPGHCTPACRQFSDLLEEWATRLGELNDEQPSQLTLLDAG